MVMLEDLPPREGDPLKAYRLVNSKYPPINVFDDVADASEFEALYQLQALTNPRLQNEVGRLELIPLGDIPFGIPGCSYAAAPFTHVNPAGSRFSDGSYGVLYLADTPATAIAEVRHHQNAYWSRVTGLSYERFVFRGLCCQFSETGVRDATVLPATAPLYAADDYSHAHALGKQAHRAGCAGLRYHSVRAPGQLCWALMTPRWVTSVVQAAHYEMIWNGAITGVNQLSNA